MDEAEQQRADTWFREKWHHGPCPVCGTDDWLKPQKLGQIENLDSGATLLEGGGLVVQAGRIPVLGITCKTCGYLVLVNALVAAVRQFPPAADADE